MIFELLFRQTKEVTFIVPKTKINSESTKFQLKDLTKNQHKHDLVYSSKCPELNCNEDYLSETRRRIKKVIGKENQSHLFKRALISNHPVAALKDLKVIDKNQNTRGKYQRLYILTLYFACRKSIFLTSYFGVPQINHFAMKIGSGMGGPKYQF